MADHTVKAFSEKLEGLTTTIAQMGGLAESQLANAIDAIARRDTALAESVIAGDPRIDAFQQQIEDQGLKLLALRQPMAVDLRETLAAIKIANELERIGDLAKNISKRAMVLVGNREPTPLRSDAELSPAWAALGAVAIEAGAGFLFRPRRGRRRVRSGATMARSTRSTTACFANFSPT